jgi:hypothetical protein
VVRRLRTVGVVKKTKDPFKKEERRRRRREV